MDTNTLNSLWFLLPSVLFPGSFGVKEGEESDWAGST